jgi:hypothetical protein
MCSLEVSAHCCGCCACSTCDPTGVTKWRGLKTYPRDRDRDVFSPAVVKWSGRARPGRWVFSVSHPANAPVLIDKGAGIA